MTAKTGNIGGKPGRTLLRWILPLLLFVVRADAQTEPLKVKLELSKGPYLVGQGIVLSAGVIAEADRPKVDPPKVPGADLWPLETDVTPLAVSRIGDTIVQENLFLTRFRLVPRRAGKFEIPSVRVEVSGRIGKSHPIGFEVEPAPIEGRPGSYLGGIGDFSVAAEADPATLRVGQSLEYRIKLDGPAAWGSTAPPSLGRFDRLPLGLRTEPIGEDLTQEPPSRTFRYLLRPTVAGDAVLPALLISSFDRKLGRYVTKTTPIVPLRVVAVAPFDPKSIDYQPPPVARLSSAFAGLIAGLLAILAWAGAWLWRRRKRRQLDGPNPLIAKRFALKTARELGTLQSTREPTTLARQTNEALIRFLELGTGRAPGALTPAEASRGFADFTGSADLGDRAERLVAACDQALYATGEHPGPEIEDARHFFRTLGSR